MQIKKLWGFIIVKERIKQFGECTIAQELYIPICIIYAQFDEMFSGLCCAVLSRCAFLYRWLRFESSGEGFNGEAAWGGSRPSGTR